MPILRKMIIMKAAHIYIAIITMLQALLKVRFLKSSNSLYVRHQGTDAQRGYATGPRSYGLGLSWVPLCKCFC